MKLLSIAIVATVCCGSSCVSSFLTAAPPAHPNQSSLRMAGFGSAGGSSSKKGGKKGKGKGNSKNNANKVALKPKGQWDKFKAMKASNRVAVAARVSADDDSGDWYEVGVVKSEGDKYTELAVALQRGIIAEHAKRMYPLQFLPKDLVEWAYKGENDDWVAVAKSKATEDDAPSNITKLIGFQGNPEKTGFYTRTGTQFGSDTNTSPALTNGSDSLDMSVLPRVK